MMKRMFAAVAALLVMFAGAGTAQAVQFDPGPSPVFSSFTFTGVCFDCENPLGVLTLKDYLLGQTLSETNFVSFTYTSSVFPTGWTITNPSELGGSISTVPGPNEITIADAFHSIDTHVGNPFYSPFPGGWTIDGDGPPLAADYGVGGTWSAGAVPEPESWAMMVMGFGLAGVALRRRARPVLATRRA